MRAEFTRLRSRRGATLAVVAVSLVALMAIMALAIDVGMMFAADSEAQRVADASALAGVSAYLDYDQYEAEPYVQQRAQTYILSNTVLADAIPLANTTIETNPEVYRVRVTVRKPGIQTWFARLLGIGRVGVTASATAEAVQAGGAKCVRPWAIQDMWHEPDGTGGERYAREGDAYGDGNGDRYQAVPPTDLDDPLATGYGSAHPIHIPEDRDFGTQIVLKAQTPVKNPNSDTWEIAQPGPGEFLIWDLPEDPTQELCYGEKKELQDYPQDICSCNKSSILLGQEYPLEFGNVVGPGFHGIDVLMEEDPDARWVGEGDDGRVEGSIAGDSWIDSPRVVPIALIAPLGPPDGQNWNPSSLRTVTFTNIALFFLEGYDDGKGKAQPSITGRFLYYAPGVEGPVTGSLTRYIRLVE